MQELHGGNIYRLAEKLGMDENGIIDFSASINPLGVPKSVLSEIKDNMKYIYNYPDPDAKQLRLEIARHFNINVKSIVCGNGSTELIYLVIRALRPTKALIPAPTFSEYERAVNDPEKIIRFQLSEEDGFKVNTDKFITAMSRRDSSVSSLMDSVDMAFLCNPNNPTGVLLRRDELLKIADAAKSLKCYLVVDEAFIDFSPENSMIREVENNPYLIVLRSMTKFYALSGLRVGYGIVPLPILELIKEKKEPWTVNTLAQVAGIAAINDTAYSDETFKVIKNEKKTLEDGFKLLGISYLPTSANYYLIRLQNAEEIITSLRNEGIMARSCSNFAGLDESYIRIAVKSSRDNMRLLKELAHLCRA
ncbi:MAG: threonine-phosphate decarboxylase [Nitrospirae bacterium]|nr:threonine-phosphate decarboxylase [Nitrospirota bacterium]